ncbi:MAG: hypothetical protein RLZZ480_520 [Candidatus Parcubacteria bacterium]|jgi:hypothetical protein
MLGTAITTFVTCLVLFVVMAVLVRVEEVRGKRVFLGSTRTWLDGQILALEQKVSRGWHHFTQYVVRLGWYYGIHSLLRTILSLLVSVYTYFEEMFEKNRAKTKELRQQRRRALADSHLSKIADHKQAVSLSKEEQDALLKKKLEQDH